MVVTSQSLLMLFLQKEIVFPAELCFWAVEENSITNNNNNNNNGINKKRKTTNGTKKLIIARIETNSLEILVSAISGLGMIFPVASYGWRRIRKQKKTSNKKKANHFSNGLSRLSSIGRGIFHQRPVSQEQSVKSSV